MYFSDTFAAGGSLGGLPWGPGATKSHYSEFGGVRLEIHSFSLLFYPFKTPLWEPVSCTKAAPNDSTTKKMEERKEAFRVHGSLLLEGLRS